MKFKVVTNDMKNKILTFVKHYFGVVDTPYNGPTYILPDGTMLDLSSCRHHAEVEKVLIENGFSDDIYLPTGGSPTMRLLGAIRCDTVKYYVDLPNDTTTREQDNTLLVWLDYLARQCRLVTICANEGRLQTNYIFNETIPDDIILRINRYYRCGRLYEQKGDKITRQYDCKFLRKPFGAELNEFDESTITSEKLLESKNKFID